MRPTIQQVDEFIEGWFDGSITFIWTAKDMNSLKNSLPFNLKGTPLNDTLTTVVERLGPNINRYVGAGATQKAELGGSIYQDVLFLRMFGIISNNPDTLKEVTYWKNKCLTTELALVEKDKVIDALNQDITKLRVGSGAIR
jgi:hypothetical protein